MDAWAARPCEERDHLFTKMSRDSKRFQSFKTDFYDSIKILIPNAITILSNAESKIFGKGDFEGLTGSTQPWHTALDTWASLYRLSVLAADRSPPLPKHLSFSTLAVDLCLQLLTPDSPAVPDTWDLASWFLPVERETAFLEISEPRWRPPTCHSSF